MKYYKQQKLNNFNFKIQECAKEAETYRKVEDGNKDFALSSLLVEPSIRVHKYLSYFRVRGLKTNS